MTSLSRLVGSFALLSAFSSVACSAEVISAPPVEEPLARGVEAPVVEEPSEATPRPAKLRVAHMWEQRDAVEVCILGEGDDGTGIRPTYRTHGAVRERTEGGVPQYKVGKFIRLEAGQRVVKIVGADAEDCSAKEIASTTIRMEENASYTLALYGSDPEHVSMQALVDERASETGVESIRFYDFVNDMSERSAAFEIYKLEDYRQTPSDTTVTPLQIGRLSATANGETVNVDHETRENGVVSVFATGTVANGTFRVLVCRDDVRGQGPLSTCNER